MPKIDTDDDGVFELTTDRPAMQAYFDGDPFEQCIEGDVDGIINQAQGWVGIHNKPAFIVIQINPLRKDLNMPLIDLRIETTIRVSTDDFDKQTFIDAVTELNIPCGPNMAKLELTNDQWVAVFKHIIVDDISNLQISDELTLEDFKSITVVEKS